MDDFESEIKLSFIQEAKELLENAEQCFLNLEKASDDPKIIEEIFRLAHNLKGSAGAVGFVDLKDFTHSLESMLLKIKNKELNISQDVINLLLECSDFIASTLDKLKDNLNAGHANPELQKKIEALMELTPKKDLASPLPEEVEFEETKESDEEVNLVLSKTESSPHFNNDSEKTKKNEASPKRTEGGESIRVSLDKIDQLLNIMGELVILQTVVDQQRDSVPNMLVHKTIGQMSKIIREAQSLSMGLRMLPIKQTFQKMQRIVRDTSAALNKEVDFHISGEDTELDKTVIEQLSDPLVHLIRNAVDHGLEAPEDRLIAGKDPRGQVHLIAFQKGGQIIIEIKDDGKGLNPESLKRKAIEKGIINSDAQLSDEECYQLIFAPGFSTKEAVTDVSGRGVGMDVVKTNISHMQGDIEVSTRLGEGTSFRILLPLTLAIMDSMIVACSDERYVVPIAQIQESVRPKSEDLSTINLKGEVLVLRGSPMPLYRLSRLLNRKSIMNFNTEDGIALICQDETNTRFAVLVNDIINQQQVVIKSLGEEIKGLHGVAGAAILGDGKTSLILDLFELTQPIRKLRSKQVSIHKEAS